MPNNVRYDEMFPTRFVDNDAPSKRKPIDYGKKVSSGGLSAAKKTIFSSQDARSLARLSSEESDPILSRAMGNQAKSRKEEALSTARQARAKALRGRY